MSEIRLVADTECHSCGSTLCAGETAYETYWFLDRQLHCSFECAYPEEEETEEEKETSYCVKFAAHMGISYTVARDCDREEARVAVAGYLKTRRREGYPVTVLEKGKEYEVLERPNAFLIDNRSGVLWIAEKE